MDLKDFSFSCPFCSHTLNGPHGIELRTSRKTGEKGMIYLSTTFGNYTYRHVPDIAFEKHEIVDFICPNCNENLNAPQHENFALLNMNVGGNINFEVIFSRESGKRKTYVITEDGIEAYQG